MNSAPEKAVRALRSLSRVLCAAALISPLSSAEPADTVAAPDPAAWIERAADEARSITGRGPGLTAALSDKGRLLADAAGLGAAGGAGGRDTEGPDRWFSLAELCERALTHRDASGPVTAALVEGLARAGSVDEAAARAETLAPGPDREAARAALARALAVSAPEAPRAAALRAGADPAAAAAWAPAFVEAGDFTGFEGLVAGTDLTDPRRAELLTGLAEAQARSGDPAAARRTLDDALALRGTATGDDRALTLALAGAYAALGRIDDADAAAGTLRHPAARVRGLSRVAAARSAAGDGPGAFLDVQAAAEVVGRGSDADGLAGAARELARVAADAGHAAEAGVWIDTLDDPRLRAAAALGLAEGLSAPGLRPRMTRALIASDAPPPAAAVDSGPETASADAAPAVVAGVTGVTRAADAEPAAAAGTDVAADAAGAELDGAAERAIDAVMTDLPGGPVTAADAAQTVATPTPPAAADPEAAPTRTATSEPWPDLPRLAPAARAAEGVVDGHAAAAADADAATGSAATRLTARPPGTAVADAGPGDAPAYPPATPPATPPTGDTPGDTPVGTSVDASVASSLEASEEATDDEPGANTPPIPEHTPPAAEPDPGVAASGLAADAGGSQDAGIRDRSERTERTELTDGPETTGHAHPDPRPSEAGVADGAAVTPSRSAAVGSGTDPRTGDSAAGDATPSATEPAHPTGSTDTKTSIAPDDAPVAASMAPPATPGTHPDGRIDAPADRVRAIAETSGAVDQAADPKTAAAPDPGATGPDVGDTPADPASGPITAVPDLRRLANPDDPQFGKPSPEVYDARFTTTRGAFTIRVHRDWAPRAADRFHQLCRAGFYNNNRFFRAVPGFVVQWGIHGFPSVAASWRNAAIPDEPVRERNRRGTVSFAAAAVPNTRTTQVFINLAHNAFLDDLGFTPFAEVIDGMDVVEQLFSGYGEAPSQLQRRIQLDGNAFLDEKFPNLDGVVGVEVVDLKAQSAK